MAAKATRGPPCLHLPGDMSDPTTRTRVTAPDGGGTAPPEQAATEAAARPRRRPLVVRVVRTLWHLIVGTTKRSQRDQVTGLASQFAYNAFIATVPLFIVIISAVAVLGGKDAADRIQTTYEEQIPEAYQTILHDVLRSAASNTGRAAVFLVLGSIGALYLVGNAIGALITGLDRAADVRHRGWVRGKVVGIAFATLWSALMTFVNGALLVGQNVIEWLGDRYELESGTVRRMSDLWFPIVVLMLLAMVWILYRYGPNDPERAHRAYTLGVLVASIGTIGFTQVFAKYLSMFDSFEVYGTLATIVVYLTFLWAIGVVLLVGAEVNQEFRHLRGRAPRRAESAGDTSV